jgi:hypothetical protein
MPFIFINIYAPESVQIICSVVHKLLRYRYSFLRAYGLSNCAKPGQRSCKGSRLCLRPAGVAVGGLNPACRIEERRPIGFRRAKLCALNKLLWRKVVQKKSDMALVFMNIYAPTYGRTICTSAVHKDPKRKILMDFHQASMGSPVLEAAAGLDTGMHARNPGSRLRRRL